MRKATVLFMLLVFLFNFAGYYAAFTALRYSVRKEIKKQIELDLPAEQLTVLGINTEDALKINWIRADKEFVYEGQMYDIVRTGRDGDMTIYECIKDTQEEMLFAHLDEHIEKHISGDKPVKNKAAKELQSHILKLFFESCEEIIFILAAAEHRFSVKTEIYQTISLSALTPPPELI